MKIYIKAYINKNLGDDLFIKILTQRYPSQIFMISDNAKYLNIKNCEYIKENKLEKYYYKVLSMLTYGKVNYINKKMSKDDIFLIIGGSMFIEDNKQKIFKYPDKINNDYFILGSNFGPYNTKRYINVYKKWFSKASDICFREQYSFNLFSDLKNVRIASDIVFSLNKHMIVNENHLKKTKKIALFSIIDCSNRNIEKFKNEYEEKIIQLIKKMIKFDYEIILMSFCESEGDEKAINRILKKLTNFSIKKYFYKGNVNEALNIINSSDIIIGSRFHANILGLVFNKTIIPIAYSDKTINVLKDINFQGIMFDIRKMKEFDIELINKSTLQYKCNIEKQIYNSNNQFYKLDKRIGIIKNE